MMRKKNITLNGKKAVGNEQLKQGDVIKLFLAEETIENFIDHSQFSKKKRPLQENRQRERRYS